MAKNQFIRARVAGWEKDCIRRKADAAHMTESEFVRRAAMDREVTVIEGMVVYLERLEANDGFYYLCQVFQPLKIKLLLW